ncbi:MAG: hypothetical protein QM689_00270 [Oscillospiraceae bacterium]
MTTKKLLLFAGLGALALAVLALGIYTMFFFAHTQNAVEVVAELNSGNATADFVSMDDTGFDRYVFYLNREHGTKEQHLAIYEKEYFLFTKWYRLQPYIGASTHSGTDMPVDTTACMLDDNNGCETQSQIFFAASDSGVAKIKYTMTYGGTPAVKEASVSDPMLFVISGLGLPAINQPVNLAKAEFYDANGQLIDTYPNGG